MDRNLVLAFALSFLVLVTWSLWQGAGREPIPLGDKPEGNGVAEEVLPEEVQGRPDPSVPIPGPAPPELSAVELPIAEASSAVIATSLYRAELTTRGGNLLHWELAQYRDASLPGEPPVELTTLDRGEGALATPFAELGLGDLTRAAFELEQPSAWEVAFRRAEAGITIHKIYSFDPETYLFRLRLEVVNGSRNTIAPDFRVAWPAHRRTANDFAQHTLVALTDGSVERAPVESLGGSGFFSRLFGGGGDGGPIVYRGGLDWAGAQTLYFLSVLIPESPRDAYARFEPIVPGESGAAIVGFGAASLPPGQRLEREYRVYIGPKESERLEAIGAHLDRSIDRGWSWVAPLTALFSWLLRAIHSVIPNYGVAIILITIFVRLGTAPLMSKQMRSMRRLGELQPKMRELQERHADDRQKQSEEMMKLYRQSGVNPLGGCFPMLLQLPVFVGLYYALQSSIDLRQAPFMLWIRDLSAPETLFVLPGVDIPVRVLPLLMGVSMVLQQKLTPTTVDPAQARMMMTVMPVMFTVLFYQFPSGLVLYWFVSNLLGIGHQLWVNRGLAGPAPRSAPARAEPVVARKKAGG